MECGIFSTVTLLITPACQTGGLDFVRPMT